MKYAVKKEIIEEYIKQHNLSKTSFCKLCGISVCTYNKIIESKNFRLEGIIKIAKLMGVRLCEMFTSD